MANIKDVAKLAGVSISTVSRVVNNSASVAQDKSDAVLRAMRELSYQPNTFAKSLVSNKSDTLGILVGNLCESFFGQMMQGIEQIARQYNKQLIISAGHHNAAIEREAIQALINRRCDALILHAKALTDYQLMELLELQPASVLINRHIPDISDQCIYLDNRHLGRQITEYLLENGHREIAAIMEAGSGFDCQERQQGYQDALAACGIISDPKLIRQVPATFTDAYKVTLQLLDSKRPFTAIFVSQITMATGVMKALRERKVQVPGDISVIAVGDQKQVQYHHPILSLGHYPILEMATQATQLALSLCDSALEKPPVIRFTSEIASGETVSQRV